MIKTAAVSAAVLLAAAALAGCSSTAPAPDGENSAVLVDSGRTGDVDWNLWAWEDSGQLCMGMGNRSGPYTSRNDVAAGEMAGSQCGFNAKTQGRTYYVSASNGTNGPPTVAVLFGPVPSAAVSVQLTSKVMLKTQALPSGAGLPAASYWVWAGPYQLPASDGALLAVPKPLDAHGKAVAFKSY